MTVRGREKGETLAVQMYSLTAQVSHVRSWHGHMGTEQCHVTCSHFPFQHSGQIVQTNRLTAENCTSWKDLEVPSRRHWTVNKITKDDWARDWERSEPRPGQPIPAHTLQRERRVSVPGP